VRRVTKDDIIHINMNKQKISAMIKSKEGLIKSKEGLIYTPHNIPVL
jgi:hypothetical protein